MRAPCWTRVARFLNQGNIQLALDSNTRALRYAVSVAGACRQPPSACVCVVGCPAQHACRRGASCGRPGRSPCTALRDAHAGALSRQFWRAHGVGSGWRPAAAQRRHRSRCSRPDDAAGSRRGAAVWPRAGGVRRRRLRRLLRRRRPPGRRASHQRRCGRRRQPPLSRRGAAAARARPRPRALTAAPARAGCAVARARQGSAALPGGAARGRRLRPRRRRRRAGAALPGAQRRRRGGARLRRGLGARHGVPGARLAASPKRARHLRRSRAAPRRLASWGGATRSGWARRAWRRSRC